MPLNLPKTGFIKFGYTISGVNKLELICWQDTGKGIAKEKYAVQKVRWK